MCIVVTLYVKNIFYDSVHLHLTTLLTSIHLLEVPILHNKKGWVVNRAKVVSVAAE